jgi:hypothetical protein
LSQGGADNVSAYWSVSGGVALLNITGAEARNYNWVANVKLLSSLNAAPPPPSFVYIFEEGFETTPNTDWTKTQGDDSYYDINDTSAPIIGSGSLKIISPTTGTAGNHIILTRTLTDIGSEFWGTALFKYPGAHPNKDVELFRVGNGRFIIRDTGSPRIQHNTIVVGSSGSTFAFNTTYRLWFYYRPSSGANDGIFRVWRADSSNTDRNSATLLREITNGDSLQSPVSVSFRATKSVSASYASEFFWDSVKTAGQEFLTVD